MIGGRTLKQNESRYSELQTEFQHEYLKFFKKIRLFIGLYSDSDEILSSGSGSMSSDYNYSSVEDIETSSKNDNVENYHEKGTFKNANNEWRILCATIENANPVLVNLNELL